MERAGRGGREGRHAREHETEQAHSGLWQGGAGEQANPDFILEAVGSHSGAWSRRVGCRIWVSRRALGSRWENGPVGQRTESGSRLATAHVQAGASEALGETVRLGGVAAGCAGD